MTWDQTLPVGALGRPEGSLEIRNLRGVVGGRLGGELIPVETLRAEAGVITAIGGAVAGADVVLTEYPDASHSYDMFFLKQPVKLAQAPNPHNCRLVEGGNGQILNGRTGNPFDLNDPCVEKGATIAYNEAATVATTKAVTEFLVATFHLKP